MFLYGNSIDDFTLSSKRSDSSKEMMGGLIRVNVFCTENKLIFFNTLMFFGRRLCNSVAQLLLYLVPVGRDEAIYFKNVI